MSDSSIAIRGEPVTAAKCKFIVDRPVYPARSFYFSKREQADGSPLASALFQIEGVNSVLLAHNVVTVTKTGAAEWPVIGKQVGAAIRAHLTSGEPAVSESLQNSLPPTEVIRGRVEQVLKDEVGPMVASHGGSVRLLDVRENTVFLQMGGGCQGCGSATAFLKQGIDAAIRAAIPEVGDIVDATDHAAGTNPYQAATRT